MRPLTRDKLTTEKPLLVLVALYYAGRRAAVQRKATRHTKRRGVPGSRRRGGEHKRADLALKKLIFNKKKKTLNFAYRHFDK